MSTLWIILLSWLFYSTKPNCVSCNCLLPTYYFGICGFSANNVPSFTWRRNWKTEWIDTGAIISHERCELLLFLKTPLAFNMQNKVSITVSQEKELIHLTLSPIHCQKREQVLIWVCHSCSLQQECGGLVGALSWLHFVTAIKNNSLEL